MRTLLLLLILICSPAQAQKLTLAANEWHPFTGEDLINQGYASDVVREIFRLAGYDVDVRIVPWSEAMEGTIKGDFDGLIAVWFTEERARQIHYTLPYMDNRIRFLKKRGSPIEFTGLDALKAYRIGVIEGYAYSPDFQARDDLNRVLGKSFTDNVRKVASGEIDLTLEDEIAGRFELINSAPELVRQVEFINPPLNQNPLHVAISRQNPDHEKIAADFNAAMAHFVKNEGIRSIQKMHGL